MSFRIGCAIWSFKGWRGVLYPEKAQPKDFLRLYGERLTAVEGNTTFYATPSKEMIVRWAETLPVDFKFCPKLSRTITHEGPLSAKIDEAYQFQGFMLPLGSRLGPCFAQLPPSYGPEKFADLKEFLQAWSYRRSPLALEVRHIDWFSAPHSERLNDLLTGLGVARVHLDTRPIFECPGDPQALSKRKKPRLPMHPVATAKFSFIRYISHPEIDRNDPYLEQWADRITQQLSEGQEVYFFAHCPEETHSPLIAKSLQQRLEERQARVPFLPWNNLPEITKQPNKKPSQQGFLF